MTLPIKAFLYKKSMLYDIALKAFLYKESMLYDIAYDTENIMLIL